MIHSLIHYRALLPVFKPFVLLAYTALGLFLVWLAAGRGIQAIKIPWKLLSVLAGSAVTVVAIWFTLHGPWLLISVAIGAGVFAIRNKDSRRRALMLHVTGVIIAAFSLAWWLIPFEQPTGWWHPAVFGVIAWCVQAG